MVDVIITCQSRRKILYTVGLGFMLILGLQGLPSGPKNCIQPYSTNEMKQLLHLQIKNKIFIQSQVLYTNWHKKFRHMILILLYV